MIGIILRNIKNILIGWCLCVPIAMLVPKKKNLVLFIGRVQGKFFGNVKQLYLHLHQLKDKNVKYYFFTQHKSVYKQLKEYNLPVIYHPTLFSIYILLRTNVIIASSTAWIKKCKYHLLFKTKKVQIFHGLALKKVELGISSRAEYNNSLKGRLNNGIRGRFPLYDVVVSTSKFCTEQLFSKSFRAGTLIEGGFPRNDIFFNDTDDDYTLLGSDKETISEIAGLREQGYKIVLYAPTFRDTNGDVISDNVLDLDRLSKFANGHKLIFVFKFHLSTGLTTKLKTYNNIFVYDNSGDIQPLLKVSDILITDYSSVCIDYLLLDRPMIFFVYDYEKYITKDRELLFDYNWITAGPKCCSQEELEKEILAYIEGKDDFAGKRLEVRDVMFAHKDGNSSERVWGFIEKNYL